jgi:flagellar hook protein FlgE
MSILNGMYTGVSGIIAEGEALSVVGDNIANTNTVGFKQQRANFEDMLGHSITAGAGLPGSGVHMAGVQQLFTQGSLSNTGVATDVALSGEGFFVVNGTVDGVSSTFYTRAGQLKVDANGFLTDPSGLNVQGYPASPDGTMSPALTSLQVPTSAISPKPTNSMTVTANLDANATIPTAAWDATTPTTTSNFSTSVTAYDSLGNAHPLDVYFVKTAANSWDYHVVAPGGDTGGTPGTNLEVGTGTLSFTTDGALDSLNTTTPIAIDFNGATAGQAIAVNFGNGIAGGGSGLDGITQFSGGSSVSSQSQDGYASGDLAGITIDGQGVVRGAYSNGQKLAIGQLTIAKFRSNEGLGRAGHNLWIATRDSGAAALGTAGSGGRGAVSSGALEQSNVDLAHQFVDLIAHQRAFQADSKTITTADEMLQELVNLKR